MSNIYLLDGKMIRAIIVFAIVSFCICGISHAQPVIGFNSKVTGLSSPVDVVNAGDQTNRLFVVEQTGTIKAFDQNFNLLGNFLTVTGISTGGERGLLSVAFHPDYINNGFFFVYYTNTAGDVEVARYHTPAATPNAADPASKQILLTIPHPGQANHNGGKLNFGPDGYLYFATGDGGGGGDVPNNAQSGNVLLGKMIRINVTTSATAPFYTIPPDNPFLSPGDGILDEIYSLGLRNPFRWSFDRLTHDMWIADVGQDAWEEVDFRPAGSTGGLNYGWHCLEGTHSFNGCAITIGAYAPPLLEYPHNNATGGFAIIGGYVYRGALNPAMYGYYIFADEVSHNVWLLPPGGTASDTIEFANALTGISGFGEAENGELYTVSVTSGQLFSVVASGNAALPVKLISFDGLAGNGYNDLAWTTAAEQQLRGYDVEYSTDAIHFQLAGTVGATNAGAYRFRHTLSTQQKLYYRLKMVDIDGSTAYSKVILVDGNGVRSSSFVQPSIVENNTLNINLSSSFNLLQMLNMEGRIVYQSSISNRSGRFSLSLPRLAAGQYLVRVYGNGKQMTQKVVVK